MELATQVKELVAASQTPQKVLAANWAEHWNVGRVDRQALELSTVESRLSELINGKSAGARFFFRDGARSKLLLDLLKADPEARAQVLAAAEEALKSEPPCRFLVALAEEKQVPDPARWEALRVWLERPGLPRPAKLVVSKAQYDVLPRPFDRIDGLTTEVAETDGPTALPGLVRGVVEVGGLVACSLWLRPEVPYDQWVAIGWEKSELSDEPTNWRETWQAESRLPGLPQVTHPLNQLDHEEATDAPPLPTGPALRRHVAAIVIGDAPQPPEARLHHARLLEIDAGARPDEVTAHQRRQEDAQIRAAAVELGAQLHDVSTADLEQVLRRARYQTTRGVYRDGATWHWVNVAPPAGLPSGRVKQHTVEVQPSALDRLWTEVKDWTVDDLAADPLLADVAARLDPEQEDLAIRLARAWLLLDNLPANWPKPAPSSEPASDPLGALRTLLEQSATPTELWLRPTDQSAWTNQHPARWSDPTLGLQRFPIPGEVVRLRRDQPLAMVNDRHRHSHGSTWGLRGALCRHVPTRRDQTKGDETFGAALERAGASSGQPRSELDRMWVSEPLTAVKAPSHDIWQMADRTVGQLRRRLRSLTMQGEIDLQHDGAILFPVLPGVDAQVILTRRTGTDCGAGLQVPVTGKTGRIELWTEQRDQYGQPKMAESGVFALPVRRIWLHFVGSEGPKSASIEHPLPHAVYLWSETHLAEISFVQNLFTA